MRGAFKMTDPHTMHREAGSGGSGNVCACVYVRVCMCVRAHACVGGRGGKFDWIGDLLREAGAGQAGAGANDAGEGRVPPHEGAWGTVQRAVRRARGGGGRACGWTTHKRYEFTK